MHERIERSRPGGGFIPGGDHLFDLDGSRAAGLLTNLGYHLVGNEDIGSNGIAVTRCGAVLSTNGYVSFLPEGVEIRGLKGAGKDEHGREAIEVAEPGEPVIGYGVYVRQADGTAQWHSDHDDLGRALRAARGGAPVIETILAIPAFAVLGLLQAHPAVQGAFIVLGWSLVITRALRG